MYRITLSRDYFTFSAAHFVVDENGDGRELLHGHNYKVTAIVESAELRDQVVVDFAALKQAIRVICGALNHRLLLPRQNSLLRLGRGDSSIGVRTRDASFVFPSQDVIVLPIANVTCETLAWWIGEGLRARKNVPLQPRMRVEVIVEECPGQSGSYSFIVSEQASARREVTEESRFEYNQAMMKRAIDLAYAASESGGSPFGAVVVQGDECVAEAGNETAGDSAVNHAEIAALRRVKADADKEELTLYASCEPCLMCLMAAYYCSIAKIVYATPIAEAVRRASGDLPVDARAFAAALDLPMEIVGPVDAEAGRRLFDSHIERWGKL